MVIFHSYVMLVYQRVHTYVNAYQARPDQTKHTCIHILGISTGTYLWLYLRVIKTGLLANRLSSMSFPGISLASHVCFLEGISRDVKRRGTTNYFQAFSRSWKHYGKK